MTQTAKDSAEKTQPWEPHEWPCPGYYVGNHQAPMSWTCTCSSKTAPTGYDLNICRCDGGPYLGARQAGAPCCCERCGFMTEDQRVAIIEGNDRMHRALSQAKDRYALALEQRLSRIRDLVRAPEADRYRDEACRHVVAQPYADNRYVRLLDAIREAVRDA